MLRQRHRPAAGGDLGRRRRRTASCTRCGLFPVTTKRRRASGSMTGVPRMPSPPRRARGRSTPAGRWSRRRRRRWGSSRARGTRRRGRRPAARAVAVQPVAVGGAAGRRGTVLEVEHRRGALVLRVAVGGEGGVGGRMWCPAPWSSTAASVRPGLSIRRAPVDVVAALEHRLRAAGRRRRHRRRRRRCRRRRPLCRRRRSCRRPCHRRCRHRQPCHRRCAWSIAPPPVPARRATRCPNAIECSWSWPFRPRVDAIGLWRW